MSQKEEKTVAKSGEKTVAKSDVAPTFRPVGISYSFVVFALVGVYYLAYPLLRDSSLYPLYIIGGLSLIGSLGLMRMSRWGLWMGLLLYPLQVIASSFALMAVLGVPGLTSDYVLLGFIASVVVLIFLTTLSFLFVLDKRKSFK
jgi:hypothetical protein